MEREGLQNTLGSPWPLEAKRQQEGNGWGWASHSHEHFWKPSLPPAKPKQEWEATADPRWTVIQHSSCLVLGWESETERRLTRPSRRKIHSLWVSSWLSIAHNMIALEEEFRENHGEVNQHVVHFLLGEKSWKSVAGVSLVLKASSRSGGRRGEECRQRDSMSTSLEEGSWDIRMGQETGRRKASEVLPRCVFK